MKCPQPELPHFKRTYSTTELNANNQTIKPCNLCSKTKRLKCAKKMLKNKGTDGNPPSIKKQIKSDTGKKQHPPQIEGKMINRRFAFKIEPTGKTINGIPHNKLIKIPFVRLVNMHDRRIHP